MNYKIIKSDPTSDTLQDFEKQVNEYTQDGWKPQGGIVVLPVDTGDKHSLATQLLQAIYK